MLAATFASLCRPDGAGLPHPDPRPERLAAIVAALRAAWTCLRATMHTAGHTVGDLDEDQTTEMLLQALHRVMDDEAVPGFAPEFYAVNRDPKVVNCDGLHPDKMPDLAFSLRPDRPGLPPNHAVHVECKPVDHAHGHKPYRGRDGMGCFIHGDYGCTMRVGLMVAYADPGYSFAGKVLPKLRSAFGKVDDLHATRTLPAEGVDPPASLHRRDWAYANGAAPGDIRLLHVWLTR